MGTSAQRGKTTRRRLLDAAVPLIGEVGWDRVTTRLVAERAGVNPGVVHYHFSSVADLLAEASTEVIRALLDQAARELAEQGDPARGLERLLTELAGYTGTDPVSSLFAEAFLAAGRHEELRARLAPLLIDFRARVADWLRAHGHGPDAAATAAVLAACLDGLVLHRALDPDLDPAELGVPLRRMLGADTHDTTEHRKDTK